MKRMMQTAGGLVVLVWLAACGSNTSSGDGGPGPALADLANTLAPAVCDQITQCVAGSFLVASVGGSECEDHVTAQLEDKTIAQLTAATKAGTVHYHDDQVAACVSGIKKVGCGITAQRLKDVSGCSGVFEGTIAIGKDCDIDEACTGQAYCKKGDTCPGVCTALGAKGDSCTRDDECKNGMTCSSNGKCATPAAAGAACGQADQPDCALGLVCAGADSAKNVAGKCKAIADVFVGKAGDACDLQAGKFCADGLSCIAMITNATASFMCAKKVAAGAACHYGLPSQCPDTQYCNADLTKGSVDGTCVDLPKAGKTCLAMPSIEGACAPGLSCAGDGKCHALGRIGDACTDSSDCASELCDADKCAKPVECKL